MLSVLQGGHCKTAIARADGCTVADFFYLVHCRLEVLLLVQDSQPFSELADIVALHGDDRVRIFAKNEGPEYAAKRSDGSWNPEYHDMLYKLTDDAIQGRHEHTSACIEIIASLGIHGQGGREAEEHINVFLIHTYYLDTKG